MNNAVNVDERIKRVYHIPAGENVKSPIVVLEIGSRKQNIVRTPTQFILDLKNSHLLPNDFSGGMNSPQVTKAMRKLRNGNVEANVKFWNKGDEYVADEYSSAVTDPNHELFGQVKAGDKLQHEADGSRVEDGFLYLEVSEKYMMFEEQADAAANTLAQLFSKSGAAVPSVSTVDAAPTEASVETDETEEKPASGKGSKKKATATA